MYFYRFSDSFEKNDSEKIFFIFYGSSILGDSSIFKKKRSYSFNWYISIKKKEATRQYGLISNEMVGFMEEQGVGELSLQTRGDTTRNLNHLT